MPRFGGRCQTDAASAPGPALTCSPGEGNNLPLRVTVRARVPLESLAASAAAHLRTRHVSGPRAREGRRLCVRRLPPDRRGLRAGTGRPACLPGVGHGKRREVRVRRPGSRSRQNPGPNLECHRDGVRRCTALHASGRGPGPVTAPGPGPEGQRTFA